MNMCMVFKPQNFVPMKLNDFTGTAKSGLFSSLLLKHKNDICLVTSKLSNCFDGKTIDKLQKQLWN